MGRSTSPFLSAIFFVLAFFCLTCTALNFHAAFNGNPNTAFESWLSGFFLGIPSVFFLWGGIVGLIGRQSVSSPKDQ